MSGLQLINSWKGSLKVHILLRDQFTTDFQTMLAISHVEVKFSRTSWISYHVAWIFFNTGIFVIKMKTHNLNLYLFWLEFSGGYCWLTMGLRLSIQKGPKTALLSCQKMAHPLFILSFRICRKSITHIGVKIFDDPMHGHGDMRVKRKYFANIFN